MQASRTFLACLPGLLAVPMLAQQPQIGGGTCSTATLTGNYSITLTGRSTSLASFLGTTESVGTANFDGLSKITLTMVNNTNKTFNTPQTLTGTYNLQANCLGTVTITSGDMATFTIESYNQGKDYLMTGMDGTYALTASGGILPATCPSTLTAATYPINGTGFGLNSGALSSVFTALGTLQLSGSSTAAMNLFIAASGGTKNISATGSYTVMPNCLGSATLSDSSGNSYTLSFVFTTTSGGNFILATASSTLLFTGTGRPL